MVVQLRGVIGERAFTLTGVQPSTDAQGEGNAATDTSTDVAKARSLLVSVRNRLLVPSGAARRERLTTHDRWRTMAIAVTFNPSIGVSDFKKLREERLTYVDKSRLVIDLIDRPGLEVVLFPRPRRFGKTLNLSMLRYFFERSPEDRTALFEGLEVFEAGPRYREHFGRYPVVFMSFRDVKASGWEDAWEAIQRKVREVYIEHRAVLDSATVSSFHRADYVAVLDGTATHTSYERALGDLTRLLHQAHGERAVVLIDEYDEPIHAAHVHGYGREMLESFRAFLFAGLKDNSHVKRGVLTGILRVAKGSIFSGLNNLRSCRCSIRASRERSASPSPKSLTCSRWPATPTAPRRSTTGIRATASATRPFTTRGACCSSSARPSAAPSPIGSPPAATSSSNRRYDGARPPSPATSRSSWPERRSWPSSTSTWCSSSSTPTHARCGACSPSRATSAQVPNRARPWSTACRSPIARSDSSMPPRFGSGSTRACATTVGACRA
jgi:hypothetical protein